MANTGNTQQIINYGATANDGTGDPLRTAFIKTDENFDNVWLAGPVGSNITIVNNTVQTNNTNGNIVLRPNGTGVIQANAAIVPNATNTRDLGSAGREWRTAYANALAVSGDAVITGNLTAGNIKYTSNVFIGDLQGSVFADDSTLMVDAVDNTMMADSADFGVLTVTGNITGDYILGNGAFLTGISVASPYGNANVADYLPTYTGNISAGNVNVVANIKPFTAGTGYLGSLSNFWSQGYIQTLHTSTLLSLDANAIQINELSANIIDTGNITGNGTIRIDPDGGSNVWTFGENGFLTLPSGAQWASQQGVLDDYIISAPNGFLNLQSYNLGAPASEINLQHDLVRLKVYNGPNEEWDFKEDGSLCHPGNIGIKDANTHVIGNTTNWWSAVYSQQFIGNSISVSGLVQTGNIIPSANAIYSLGNSTNYWSNLWVANNTIFIGGVPLGVTGNTLTVNGEAVLSNDSDSSITTTGNISAGNISVTGDIDANNYVYFRGGTLIGDETDGNIFRITSPLGYGVVIEADANIEGSNWQWTFDNSGTLGLPDKGSLYPSADDNAGLILLDTDSGNRAQLSAIGNVQLRSDSANSGYEWVFDTTGNLTAPGNISAANFIVSESLIGSDASPQPTISGFSTISATGNISGANLITTGNVVGNVSGFAIGYRDIPQVSFTGNATIATTDAGKHFYSTQSTDYILTIANNASQGFQVGAAITIVNQGTGNITIAQGSGVSLYLASNATSGNRNLTTFGMATIMKVATDTWFINGTGVA